MSENDKTICTDVAVKHCKCQYHYDRAAKQHKHPKKSSSVAGPGQSIASSSCSFTVTDSAVFFTASNPISRFSSTTLPGPGNLALPTWDNLLIRSNNSEWSQAILGNGDFEGLLFIQPHGLEVFVFEELVKKKRSEEFGMYCAMPYCMYLPISRQSIQEAPQTGCSCTYHSGWSFAKSSCRDRCHDMRCI
jgi:hypothetical protein